jgi:ADP-dependent NAD(P)H-hydrate dehydratase / NAD(P)H-hydrate epimerase
MRLCSAAEMMETDRQAIKERGIPGVVLMENAGRACCRLIDFVYGDHFPGPILVVAGKGNNGGDGYVIARILGDAGWQVNTIVLGEESDIQGDANVMLQIMKNLQQQVHFIDNSLKLKSEYDACKPTVIVDAVFGTGLSSAVRGLQAEAISLINRSSAAVVAVDIPSGVDGSNGQILGPAVNANLTVTFDQAKIGHGSRPGSDYVGQLEVVDIGIPKKGRHPLVSQVQLVDSSVAREMLPQRMSVGHKGRFGHLLVVAGSPGKSGAAVLSGEAAVRSGCGLVTVAVPASIHDIIEVKLTEAMSCPLVDGQGLLIPKAADKVLELLSERQALAIGPGLGTSEGLEELLCQLLKESQVPTVIDADGLNLLCGQIECLAERNSNSPIVLTPHPGEMARLTGLSISDIEADRFNVTQAFAQEHGVVVLLKGARTVIAAPDGRVNINASGNDGLASGGSGDVLTGLIGGLLAQGIDGFNAASLGAWLHGRSAELVATMSGTAGMAASDLLPQLPVSRQELVKGDCL